MSYSRSIANPLASTNGRIIHAQVGLPHRAIRAKREHDGGNRDSRDAAPVDRKLEEADIASRDDGVLSSCVQIPSLASRMRALLSGRC
jgi:hypothetical protein